MKSHKTLVEATVEYLDSLYLSEMASDRSKAINDVTNIAPRIVEHIVLAVQFPDNDASNHWKSEINGFLAKITEIKLKGGKNSTLSEDMFRAIFIDKNFYSIATYDKIISKLSKSKNMRISSSGEVYSVVTRILEHICKDLADRKLEDINYYLEMYQ